MKSILGGLVVTSAVVVCGPAVAADRCRLVGGQSTGETVLVRHPIPDPADPTVHTNKHVVWLVDGERATFGGALGGEDPAVIAVADFNPGNTCDMLWEWHAHGANGADGPTLLAVGEGFTQLSVGAFAQGTERPPGPWQLAGAFDLVGDGQADLLWWNPATGGLLFWNRTSNGGWEPTEISGGLPAPWRPVAVARLESNGPPGVIWSDSSQNVSLYYQRTWWSGDHLELQPVGPMSLSADAQWLVVAVGDFDGDGKEDLMRQEQGSPFGRLQVCLMDGIALAETGCGPLDPERLEHPLDPALAWYVVGSR